MRRIALLVLLLAAISVHPQTLTLERGDVIAQISACSARDLSPCPANELVIADSFGIPKPGTVPGLPKYFGPYGLFFVDASRAIYTSFTNGRYGLFEWRAGLGGSASSALVDEGGTETLRMRNGDLLTAIYISALSKPAIMRFTLAGDMLRIYAIPDMPVFTGIQYPNGIGSPGVARMELLADQCTLLWTPNTIGHFPVHTLDICSGSAKALFLDPTPQFESDIERIGSIRALPNGDVLIATQKDVRRFDRTGKKVATYQAPATFGSDTLLALTPDASGVWIGRDRLVHRIDFASPSSPAATFLTKELTHLIALSVIGEWRASEQPLIPRRRSVR